MHITIHRRLIWIAIIGAALAGLGAYALPRLALPPADAAAVPPDQAAAAFTRAFYTVDYRDREGWLATLEPLAGASGFRLIAGLLAPATWPRLAEAQTVTLAEQVEVRDEGVRAEGVGAGEQGSWQIRRLTVTVAEAGRWPTMTAGTFPANILLVQEGGAWKFGAFLSDDDVRVFQTRSQ